MSHSDLADFHAKHFGNQSYQAFFETAIRHSVEQSQFAQYCTSFQNPHSDHDTADVNDYEQDGEEEFEDVEITLTPEARAFLLNAAINQKRREQKCRQEEHQEALEAEQFTRSSDPKIAKDVNDLQHTALTNPKAKQDT